LFRAPRRAFGTTGKFISEREVIGLEGGDKYAGVDEEFAWKEEFYEACDKRSFTE